LIRPFAAGIRRHLSPRRTSILRTEQARQVRHRSDFLRVRRMRHDILDRSTSAGSKGLSNGISHGASGENSGGKVDDKCDELTVHRSFYCMKEY